MPFNGPEVERFWVAVRESTTHLDCACCKKRKSVDEFDKSNITLTRREPRCKDCRREVQQKSSAQPSKRMSILVKSALSRAVFRGLPFDGDLREMLMKKPPLSCACCGRAFDYSAGRGQVGRDKSPSLDRLVPEKGYVKGNVAVICWRCNRLKSNASVKDIETILAYVEKHTAC